MNPATREPDRRDDVGLLVLDASGARTDSLSKLPQMLHPGDVVVVNDAATFPGSLALRTGSGEAVEIRLIEERPGRFLSIALGSGDWRTDTDERPPPPPLAPGDRLYANNREVAEVVAIDPRSARLLELSLGRDPWSLIYRIGRPIQYSYLESDLELWSIQTSFASRPLAAEMPSAGRPLSWSVIAEFRARDIEVVALTHAAGLSATGDPALDALLPFPERYHIPAITAAAVNGARGDVIAIGTTVARALESSARASKTGLVLPGPGLATLRIDADTPLYVTDAILTGLHDVGASHRTLLEAFADLGDLDRAWTVAARAGFRSHELGDVALVRNRRRQKLTDLGLDGRGSSESDVVVTAIGDHLNTERQPGGRESDRNLGRRGLEDVEQSGHYRLQWG